MEEEIAKELQKSGAKSLFAKQRLKNIEEEVTKAFFNAIQFQKTSQVIKPHNRAVEVDDRAKNQALMQGQYEFKFGPSTVTLEQKLAKITGEKIAYHLYKRRDLESKIDKLAISQLRMAKLIFTVTQTARKERRDYLRMKQKKQEEAERIAEERAQKKFEAKMKKAQSRAYGNHSSNDSIESIISDKRRSPPNVSLDPSGISNAAQFSNKNQSSSHFLKQKDAIRDEAVKRQKQESQEKEKQVKFLAPPRQASARDKGDGPKPKVPVFKKKRNIDLERRVKKSQK